MSDLDKWRALRTNLRRPNRMLVVFMVTFSGDEQCAAEIRRRFDRFIEEVEQLAQGARVKRTYQLNFDFFPWA